MDGKLNEICNITSSKSLTIDASYFSQVVQFFETRYCRKQPPKVFYKRDILKSFAKFTGKHLCHSLFFNKIAGLKMELFVTIVNGL